LDCAIYRLPRRSICKGKGKGGGKGERRKEKGKGKGKEGGKGERRRRREEKRKGRGGGGGAMLFGVAPSAKNSDFTAKLRHPPSVFIYLFCAIYFQGGVY